MQLHRNSVWKPLDEPSHQYRKTILTDEEDWPMNFADLREQLKAKHGCKQACSISNVNLSHGYFHNVAQTYYPATRVIANHRSPASVCQSAHQKSRKQTTLKNIRGASLLPSRTLLRWLMYQERGPDFQISHLTCQSLPQPCGETTSTLKGAPENKQTHTVTCATPATWSSYLYNGQQI